MPLFLVAAWRAATSPLGRVTGVVMVVIAILAVVHHDGERAGAAHVTQRVEKAHTAAVAVARGDERAAASTSTAIAADVGRQTAASATATSQTIEDLHHAIDAVPPAAPDAALPAAPVDRVRDDLNARIADASRAADALP